MESRFCAHYLFHDTNDTQDGFVRKLGRILKERFPGSQFDCPYLPYLLLPGESMHDMATRFVNQMDIGIIPCSLFVGMGLGAVLAYRLQRKMAEKGNGTFEICPLPGPDNAYMDGLSRVLIYPSSGSIESFCNPDKSVQKYGLPALIHGPSLATYAIAYLIGKYMQHEDISEDVQKLFMG